MKWTEDEMLQLAELARVGPMTVYEIATEMGRSLDSVVSKLRRMGVVTKTDKIQPMKVNDKVIKELERRIREQDQELRRKRENYSGVKVDSFRGPKFRFIACGDSHLGSNDDRHDIVRLMFEYAKKEKIKHIFHAGDISDGMRVYKGQQYEQDRIGADSQLAHILEIWPQNSGIETYLIAGNHDKSFFNYAEFDICKHFADENKDVHYLGMDRAILTVSVDGTPIRIGLWHPDGGTAQAVSYRPQKLIEALPGGEKPHVLLFGHFHKAEFMPSYRNVAEFQVGTLCSQTAFMRRRALQAHVGFWIIEIQANESGLAAVSGRFVPFFEAW